MLEEFTGPKEKIKVLSKEEKALSALKSLSPIDLIKLGQQKSYEITHPLVPSHPIINNKKRSLDHKENVKRQKTIYAFSTDELASTLLEIVNSSKSDYNLSVSLIFLKGLLQSIGLGIFTKYLKSSNGVSEFSIESISTASKKISSIFSFFLFVFFKIDENFNVNSIQYNEQINGTPRNCVASNHVIKSGEKIMNIIFKDEHGKTLHIGVSAEKVFHGHTIKEFLMLAWDLKKFKVRAEEHYINYFKNAKMESIPLSGYLDAFTNDKENGLIPYVISVIKKWSLMKNSLEIKINSH